MRTPLQKEEKILLVTYSSWTTLVLPALIAIIILFMGVFIAAHFHQIWASLLCIVAAGYWLIHYYSWRVNIWVVTSFGSSRKLACLIILPRKALWIRSIMSPTIRRW